MIADLFVSIEIPLRSDSISPEETTKSKSLMPHGHCCEASKLAETTTERERMHADARNHATNMGILPNHAGGERRRDKVKRFVAKKGPRIAGAAAAVGMFIFNVVTSCT
jgi:hypothetical protein